MHKEFFKGKNFRVGAFVLTSLVLLVWMILRVSQGGLFFSGTYPLYLEIESAVGLSKNTPVQIAGVDVGVVEDVELLQNSHARLKISLKKSVKVSPQAQARIKTTGILGDAYIEIYQKAPSSDTMKSGDTLTDVVNYGDFNSITSQVGSIADDVKAITIQLRKVMAGDDSTFNRIFNNMEKISTSLANVTTKNEENLNVLIANLKALSQNLNAVVARNMGSVDRSIYNIEDITNTIAKGEGTVGKLIKDDETVTRLNDALESLNSFLGGANRTEFDLGMHSEYLAGTGDFKNYVGLAIKPRPDKYFLFELVSDPDPSLDTTIEETSVTSGSTTSTITTTRSEKQLDSIRFSAQIAKKYQDITIRGGLIESTGGVGLDYNRGPFGLSFSAFDFKSFGDQKPHLKAWGKTNITNSFFLLGGVDDIINPDQDLAWFLGAGLEFTDDDIKSLLGAVSAGAGGLK